jgi:RNA-directed DNA polymerase
MKRARERIRELTPLHRMGLPVSMVVQEINQFLAGWAAYFRYGNSTRQLRAMDKYVVEQLCRFIARKYGRRGMLTCPAIPISVCVHWRERLSTILRMSEMKGSGEPCDGERHARFDEGRLQSDLPRQPSTLLMRNVLSQVPSPQKTWLWEGRRVFPEFMT